MYIGSHHIHPATALAPMAGVTDKPFRILCKAMGATLAVSEMTSADPSLWHTSKSRQRMDHVGEPDPVIVQISGYDANMLADAARFNVDHGADIIDINMGCPVRKVCQVLAGSALLRDEPLVADILGTVVKAVNVPVTLKMRTGWDRQHNNALTIAHIAEEAGIAALAIHGRSRADKYRGEAEYDSIAKVKQAISIPVFANGDIASPEKAHEVLAYTTADGIMIGRGAQGRPWIFREINHYLATGKKLPPPSATEIGDILCEHLARLYAFYDEYQGVRIARKHLAWYAKDHPGAKAFRQCVNKVESAKLQWQMTRDYFDELSLAA